LKNFDFADKLLAWYDTYGRKDLPWQQQPTPYHVWLSEIMLQQTQVSTVIDYYNRFTARFPDIRALASADLDEVLANWSGLGYYARARNLHKTAQIVSHDHDGKLPADFDALMALPGIGRSTAGAILTLAFHQRFPILDGNVKRVLTRFDAIDGWPGSKQVENQLWQRAESLLPDKRIANYIQAQMDLGATLCTRSKPDCPRCPLQSACEAFRLGRPTAYPQPRPRKQLPLRHTNWLVLKNEKREVLLLQRPAAGIWGGLWSFPEIDNADDIPRYCRQRLGFHTENIEQLSRIRHQFTHFRLEIIPYLLRCSDVGTGVADKDEGIWYRIDDALGLGLPAPVKSFLKSLQ
jgi:A/G-specific adenine glycosylase